MTTTIFRSVLTVAILISLLSCKSKEKLPREKTYNQEQITIEDVIDGNNDTGFSLYKKLGNEEKNLVLSAYSISSAMAITYAGARGTTAREISKVFNYPENQSTFHQICKQIRDSIMQADKQNGSEIKIANGLWVQDGFEITEDFIANAEQNYGAGVENLNFKSPQDQEKSRNQINKWVEDQTNNKIANLIPQGILTELTRMIITNAIYFNGNWQYPFEKQQTTESVFHINTEQIVTIGFMHQEKEFGYYEDDEVQAIQLPYKGEKTSMVIILPRETEGWKLVGNVLTAERLKIMLSHLRQKKVDLAIPRFSFENEFNLKEKLEKMGMLEAFSDDADFSGITGKPDLKIDEVIHKAFIEVNETGTEAAAATAVIMALKSAYQAEIISFHADHPFLFFVMDNTTGTIIFMGRLVKPDINR